MTVLYSQQISDIPVGFASLDGGTSGGAGGDTVFVTSTQQLVDLMKPREKNVYDPLVIFISGTMSGHDDMLDVKRTANISILGIDDSSGFLGYGIKIVDSYNIIIRNLTIADAHTEGKDGVDIQSSQNIWIDHCTFMDSPADDPDGDDHDGLLDLKRGSANVTISYNYFTNHRKTALLGHSENETGDSLIKVTYYKNWFDGTYSRHPRTRYGKVHLLNNLYSNIGGYGVGVTCAAQVFLEGNYFENTAIPVLISQVNDPDETLSGDPQGFLVAKANYSVNSGSIVENIGDMDFNPADYYSTSVEDSSLVKEIVRTQAGAGKLNIVAALRQNQVAIEKSFNLEQNYPNPFNPVTNIPYTVGANHDLPIHIELSIYNLLGQRVASLVNKKLNPGKYQVQFNGTGLNSGIYIYRLKMGSYSESRKMIKLK